MPNAYLAKRQHREDEHLRTGERVGKQYAIDSFQLALARYPKLDLGYQRIMEITELAEQIREEYKDVIQRGPEQDVARAHMDAEFEQIAGSKTIPFETRYPELKTPRYDRRYR